MTKERQYSSRKLVVNAESSLKKDSGKNKTDYEFALQITMHTINGVSYQQDEVPSDQKIPLAHIYFKF